MECDQTNSNDNNTNLSYFAYGAIGSFCYGEIIHQHHANKTTEMNQSLQASATLNRFIDIKEDNSRVSCIRFLKESPYPILLVLTESGSLIVHDCLNSEDIVHYKRNELLNTLIGPTINKEEHYGEHSSKRAKFDFTQQVNSCCWPNAENILLGLSLLREKTCLLVRLKTKDVIKLRSNPAVDNKNSFIQSHERLELNLSHYSSPIRTIESIRFDDDSCIVAVAQDDGLITVIRLNYNTGQSKRFIKLTRHKDEISCLSMFPSTKRFPLGLLASVSRSGLVLVWDIENEFYFADYQAIHEGSQRNRKVNWFALSFLPIVGSKHIHLAVSNCENGITVLELPDNARSKVRLRDNSERSRKQNGDQLSIRHIALIFNIEYDPITKTVVTSSLDGNHILWHIETQPSSKNSGETVCLKPQFLYPAMCNNSRAHMLRHSPIREDLLALALGKAGVKFFKISKDIMARRYDMNSSCAMVARKISKAKLSVTSVAWHPCHEYRLAIGTIEGKVLRVDITPRKCAMVEIESKFAGTNPGSDAAQFAKNNYDPDQIFDVDYNPIERDFNDALSVDNVNNSAATNQQFKTDGIYSLCWGPNPANPQDITKHGIYAIGSNSHKLFIYYSNKDNSDIMSNYLDEFHDQSLPEAISESSEVAWKSTMDLMALGTTDGRVIILSYLDEAHADRSRNKLFKKLAVIQGPLGSACIQCLAWHPTTDIDDSHYYFLAASSNDSPAYVFNLKESVLVADVKARLKIQSLAGDDIEGNSGLSKVRDDSMTVGLLSAYVCRLSSHMKAIADIAWNPHDPNQLATSSFDRFCYVWNLANLSMDAQVDAKFSARDRLFTLDWSLVDKDLIFTSGHDSIIWAWRPSENRVKRD